MRDSTDGLVGLKEDDRLLPFSDCPSHDPLGKSPRYRDRITDGDIELGTISSASVGIETPSLQAHEENLLTGSLDPPDSDDTGRKTTVASIFHVFSRWMKGPRPSRPFKIKPILSHVQNSPIAFLDRYLPRREQRFCLLLIVCLLWIVSFSAVLSTSISGCHISGYHTPVRLSCVSRLW